MNYRWFSKNIVFSIIFIPFFFHSAHCVDDDPKADYSRLMQLIEIEDKQSPLCVFHDFEDGFDEESHRAVLDHLNNDPDLIQAIKTELGAESLRWKLAHLEYRLLFVPEKREEYATLYERYCRDVINDLLVMTNLSNPYNDILTLTGQPPEISEDQGVSAFLVHNLVKEFSGTYIFFNQKRKKVKIQLEGKVVSGEVGFYSTTLNINEYGSFEFVNDNYTIWQNSAKNPYTALIVPVEETLHILLREYTQKAILQTLEAEGVQGLKGARKIIEDWVSVEEGIVGGLGHSLMPRILDNYVDIPSLLVEKDLENKSQSTKYRHLKKGIEVTTDLGYQKTLHLYKTDPIKFRDMLI